MEINYHVGDMFKLMDEVGHQNVHRVIPHVCNNQGAWGAGFVIPLGRTFPLAKQVYKASLPRLGDTQIVKVCDAANGRGSLWIANMVAQTLGDRQRPLRYPALARCMEKVRDAIEMILLNGKHSSVEIHAPRFGSDLAGGNWDIIAELMLDTWDSPYVPIHAYSLENPPTAPYAAEGSTFKYSLDETNAESDEEREAHEDIFGDRAD